MAQVSERLPENAAGQFFVDATCIDCGICRWVAPSSFARSPRNGLSYVHRQPTSADERERSLLALVACPTSSIGTDPHAAAAEAAAAAAAFPVHAAALLRSPQPSDVSLPDIFFCGYASPDSYGAASWMIARPAGNVL